MEETLTLIQQESYNIDKALIIERFSKALDSYNSEAFVQKDIAQKMISVINGFFTSPCISLLEIGCGTGIFSKMLIERLHPYRAVLNDICPRAEKSILSLLDDTISFQPGDAEICHFPGNHNLIASCSTLQWFSDPGYFFKRCHALLADNGYLAFTTFGTENMHEIKEVTGNTLPYRTKEELEQILDEDYELIHSEEDIIKLAFTSPLKVLYHLKHTGVSAVKKQKWTKKDLLVFCEKYIDKFGNNDGTVSLTYHPVYIIARKK